MAKTPQQDRPLFGKWLPRHPLLRELTIMMILKVLALVLIWWAFFSEPGPASDPGSVAERLTQSESRGR